MAGCGIRSYRFPVVAFSSTLFPINIMKMLIVCPDRILNLIRKRMIHSTLDVPGIGRQSTGGFEGGFGRTRFSMSGVTLNSGLVLLSDGSVIFSSS